eukprot:2117124-Pyramimonas_sp.AAC.1
MEDTASIRSSSFACACRATQSLKPHSRTVAQSYSHSVTQINGRRRRRNSSSWPGACRGATVAQSHSRTVTPTVTQSQHSHNTVATQS